MERQYDALQPPRCHHLFFQAPTAISRLRQNRTSQNRPTIAIHIHRCTTLSAKIDTIVAKEVAHRKQGFGTKIPKLTRRNWRASLCTIIKSRRRHGKGKEERRTEIEDKGQQMQTRKGIGRQHDWKIHYGIVNHTPLHIYTMGEPAKCTEPCNFTESCEHDRHTNR